MLKSVLRPMRGRAPSVRDVVRWLPVAAFVVAGLVLPPRVPATLVGAAVLLIDALGVVAAVRAVRRAPSARLGRAWAWVTGALVVQAVVGAGYALLQHRPDLSELLPAIVAARSLLTPVLLMAMLTFPGRRRKRQEVLVLGLDLTMVTGAVMLASWYFVLGPALSAGGATSLLAVVVAAGDCTLICGAAFIVLRGLAPGSRRPVGLLVGSVVCLVIPDLIIVDASAQSSSGVDRLPVWLPGIAAYLTLLAAWPASRARSSPAEQETASQNWAKPVRPHLEAIALPYVAVFLGYALLVVAALRSPLYPWGGLALGTIVMTGSVVARQLLALRENHRLAVLDHVTGAVNRPGLVAALERVRARSERTGQPAAVLLLDLDGFKAVNDSHGHEVGDEALITFADVLRNNVLGSDVVARLGGDEFVVVLNRLHRPQDAVLVAERILADLRTPRTIGGVELTLRTSIGVTLTVGSDDSPATILARADRAMYEAKRQAGSCWSVYVPGQHDAVAAPSFRMPGVTSA